VTAFFVAPYEPSEWRESHSDLRIDPTFYKERMLERWPETKFFQTSPDVPLQWMINIRDKSGVGVHGTIGMLHNDFQVVSCDTPFEEFFVWHRSLMPSKYKLFLFNDSSCESLELKPETSLDEVKQFIGGE
jgi:hypothetical protein